MSNLKRIALIPSNNGMGHFRRLESICQHIPIEKYEVTFFLDERLKQTRDFSCRFQKHNVRFIKTPLGFDGPSVKTDADFSWDNLRTELESFETVICDTVIWPTIVAKNVLFVAHFLWELYYMPSATKKGKQTLRKYINQIHESTLHFGMEAFVWKEMNNIFDTRKLPIWDYWNLRNVFTEIGDEITYSLSESFDISSNMLEVGFNYSNFTRLRGLEHYIEEKGRRPMGVVCRAGVGIISECVSAKTVPLMVSSNDTEIQFNTRRILDMGLGVELKDFIKLSPRVRGSYLMDKSNNQNWPEVLSSKEVANLLLESGGVHGYA